MRKLSLLAVLGLVLLTGCPSKDLKNSIDRTNEGVKAINRRDYEVAIGKLEEATKLYSDNHTAWYNLGLANDALKKYDLAAKSYEKAVSLSAKDAMYHMKHGIAMYKAIVNEALEKAENARKADEHNTDKTPIDPNTLDLTGANLDPAISELEQAIALNGELFRAYFYIGKIRRHQDDAQKAAEAFTKAIDLGPREVDPYIALGELYRRWNLTEEAIKVLSQGDTLSRGEIDERAELLFALGMAHADKKDYKSAIDHFTRALDTYKDIHKARYARGLSYYYTGDLRKAKEDLELYQKSAKDEFTKGVASKYVQEIITKDLEAQNKDVPTLPGQ